MTTETRMLEICLIILALNKGDTLDKLKADLAVEMKDKGMIDSDQNKIDTLLLAFVTINYDQIAASLSQEDIEKVVKGGPPKDSLGIDLREWVDFVVLVLDRFFGEARERTLGFITDSIKGQD